MKVTLFRDLPTERWWSMERYADELTRALQQIGCNVRPFVPPRPFPQLRGAPNALANYAWRTTIYPLVARAHQGDINHIVDHSYAHLIDALDARRTVVTCHDLAPLALNEGHGMGRRLWDQSFRAMLRATRIITVSAFTREELLRYTAYPADRITVVPEGVNAFFFERADVTPTWRAANHVENCQIILHVGSCTPRKNIKTLLQALAALHTPKIVLAQIGGQFTSKQREQIETLGLRDQIRQIHWVTEDELCAWYHTADVFVLPSLYEGFGLPVLEAMASRVPAICANASALPEVVGDAAILIDPREPAPLAEAIRSVLDDAVLAADLRERGSVRARQFRWENCARQTLEIYQWIASQPKVR